MPEPTPTDRLAVDVRDSLRKNRHMERLTFEPALRLVALLRQELPHIPEEHIAAVLLHAGHWLVAELPAMQRNTGLNAHVAGEYTACLPRIAGEEIHGTIQRRQAPSTSIKGTRP